ncbi:Late embryogenesis abundant hydroxyproline-rich glycoprotein family [Perilla frutescens var. hirtella]|nr:Late embryogenesis abundant hydroxyproline-rich glycoprotein family [Perilla frutescens var. hirtella]
MNDRVHPSAKPTANGGAVAPAAANGEANQTFPANKAQQYNATRPAYRPQPPPKRGHRRGCCCSCCLWTTLTIILILLLAAIAGAVFYVLYRPHRPSFTVNSLQLSKFNLTDTSLTSSFNLSITARNPNKKITFFYDTISVKFLSGDLDIADGSFPGFTHAKKNTTTLKSVISSSKNQFPDGTDTSPLKSSLKNKNLPLKIQLDTKVKAKIGKIKTGNLNIRVTCDGIKISIPTGKTASSASTSNVKCKVDPRIKIFKWTV